MPCTWFSHRQGPSKQVVVEEACSDIINITRLTPTLLMILIKTSISCRFAAWHQEASVHALIRGTPRRSRFSTRAMVVTLAEYGIRVA